MLIRTQNGTRLVNANLISNVCFAYFKDAARDYYKIHAAMVDGEEVLLGVYRTDAALNEAIAQIAKAVGGEIKMPERR